MYRIFAATMLIMFTIPATAHAKAGAAAEACAPRDDIAVNEVIEITPETKCLSADIRGGWEDCGRAQLVIESTCEMPLGATATVTKGSGNSEVFCETEQNPYQPCSILSPDDRIGVWLPGWDLEEEITVTLESDDADPITVIVNYEVDTNPNPGELPEGSEEPIGYTPPVERDRGCSTVTGDPGTLALGLLVAFVGMRRRRSCR